MSIVRITTETKNKNFVVPQDKILLIGNTYKLRDAIKNEFNGFWDSNLRGWLIDRTFIFDVDLWIGNLEPPSPKNTKRCCGLCREPGHDKNHCPTK